MRREQVIEAIEQTLARYPEIEQTIVFGSLAQGELDYDSDVDLAVSAGRSLEPTLRLALISALGESLGRPLDLVDLHTVGEPLLGQIVRHGRRLKGSDDAYARLLLRHIDLMTDFVPYRDRLLAERRRRWTGCHE